MKQPMPPQQNSQPELKKKEKKDLNFRRWLIYVVASIAVSLAIAYHGNLPITFMGNSRNIEAKPYKD